MSLANDKFPASTAADVTDEKLVAGQLRAFARDVTGRLDSIDQTLKLFARIEDKLDVIIDRQNHLDSRMADIERWQSETDARLLKLEKRRTKAAGKR